MNGIGHIKKTQLSSGRWTLVATDQRLNVIGFALGTRDEIELLYETLISEPRSREEQPYDTRTQLLLESRDRLRAEVEMCQGRIKELEQRNAVLEAEVSDEALSASGYLAILRNEGWRVAVHNDYRQDGRDWTFWLLTHPDGRWIKGEGISDGLALGAAFDATRRGDSK